ncbi:hypothetical protein ASG37_10125 [Sphingomonas sp. Leaf407]|nr:hypothetical protein ASE97_07415 [Sphingomonas sp. Leaf42]KQT27775.1 hypothetical protein ASG37_10125 [Sphingomonas sp. Leaf407]
MLAITPPAPRCERDTLALAMADELLLASQRLADLAYDLASDEVTLRRHLTSLQEVDRVTQMQLAIADLLRAGPDAPAAVNAVTLDEMRQRLLRRMDGVGG